MIHVGLHQIYNWYTKAVILLEEGDSITKQPADADRPGRISQPQNGAVALVQAPGNLVVERSKNAGLTIGIRQEHLSAHSQGSVPKQSKQPASFHLCLLFLVTFCFTI